jgi:hypothetical protein
MKPLANHKLLIDANCPMCRVYGAAFEKYNIVENNTCQPYQYAEPTLTNFIDMARAKNEIALINTQTNETVYGINALQLILSNKYSWLAPIFSSKLPMYLLKKLYTFISTNRKVIAPSAHNINTLDCTPTLNKKYRIIYFLIVAVLSSVVLNKYSHHLSTWIGSSNSFGRELLICLGQIAWQTIILKQTLKHKLYDYLGNMITVSLIGTLLLLPIMLLGKIFIIPPLMYLLYFGLVVSYMLFEHIRRCKLLNISYIASASWIVYRVLVLVVLLVV